MLPIELLWLIPIIALAIFILFIALFLQRRSEMKNRIIDLITVEKTKQAVHAAVMTGTSAVPEARINDIEQKIGTLTAALSEQHHALEKIKRENNSYVEQIDDLKGQLQTLHKEYDLVLSENFTLKARVKSQVSAGNKGGTGHAGQKEDTADQAPSPEPKGLSPRERETLRQRLLDDTRLIKAIESEENPIVDVSDVS